MTDELLLPVWSIPKKTSLRKCGMINPKSPPHNTLLMVILQDAHVVCAVACMYGCMDVCTYILGRNKAHEYIYHNKSTSSNRNKIHTG